MSVPGNAPGQPSVSIVRGLLERNLLDRAVALAESRWPGSGPLVRLAHDWAVITPAERRERLAAIGPEDLARMREVAQVQPDLARVLDDLEARGILPPVAQLPPAQPEIAAPPPATPATPDIAGQQLDVTYRRGPSPTSDLTAQPEFSPPPVELPDVPSEWDLPTPIRDLRVEMPRYEGTATRDFLEAEQERRVELMQQAESILDRVRSRVEQTATTFNDRVITERTNRYTQESVDIPPPEPVAPLDPGPSTDDSTREAVTDERPAESPPATLAQRFQECRVVTLDDEAIPTRNELQALAASLGLGYVELSSRDLPRREFWGGLEREGREVTPRAGRFPRALARHNLVVARGRLVPRTIERLREGYCDIPGTRATVAIDPRARILLIPD